MTGILLLAHGSREGDTELTMQKITEYVKAELKMTWLRRPICNSDKNLEKGLVSLINRGA
jgi:sirohydrochlorin ferrochelatase